MVLQILFGDEIPVNVGVSEFQSAMITMLVFAGVAALGLRIAKDAKEVFGKNGGKVDVHKNGSSIQVSVVGVVTRDEHEALHDYTHESVHAIRSDQQTMMNKFELYNEQGKRNELLLNQVFQAVLAQKFQPKAGS